MTTKTEKLGLNLINDGNTNWGAAARENVLIIEDKLTNIDNIGGIAIDMPTEIKNGYSLVYDKEQNKFVLKPNANGGMAASPLADGQPQTLNISLENNLIVTISNDPYIFKNVVIATTTGSNSGGIHTFSQSSYRGVSYAIHAFMDNDLYYWESTTVNNTPQWIKVDLKDEIIIRKAIIECYSGTYSPADFEIQGSNDDVNFETLLSMAGLTSSFWGSEKKLFTLGNSKPYRYYRLYFSGAIAGTASYLSIRRFFLSNI